MTIFKKHKKNILILGSNGMLGCDVYNYFIKQSQYKKSDIGIVTVINRKDKYDFTNINSIFAFFSESIHYDYCINCIAYTDTKAVENYGKEFNESYTLNALLPKYLAKACIKYKTKLIHISSDYVFSENLFLNDESNDIDYLIKAQVNFSINSTEFPCNVYGMHKLFGELFIKEQYNKSKSNNYVILRVAWLYGMNNNKSFIHKFLKNVCDKIKDRINEDDKIIIEMTSNEYSIPTSTKFVVKCIDDVIHDKNKNGVLHAVSNESNGISRFEYAKEILKAFPGDAKFNNYLINDLVNNLVKVKRDTYQPKISTLIGSFKITCFWQDELREFIKNNYTELLEFAAK